MDEKLQKKMHKGLKAFQKDMQEVFDEHNKELNELSKKIDTEETIGWSEEQLAELNKAVKKISVGLKKLKKFVNKLDKKEKE